MSNHPTNPSANTAPHTQSPLGATISSAPLTTEQEFETGIRIIRDAYRKKIATKDTEIDALYKDLRRRDAEIQDLQLRIVELEARLAKSDKRIADLSKLVTRLNQFRQNVLDSLEENDLSDFNNVRQQRKETAAATSQILLDDEAEYYEDELTTANATTIGGGAVAGGTDNRHIFDMSEFEEFSDSRSVSPAGGDVGDLMPVTRVTESSTIPTTISTNTTISTSKTASSTPKSKYHEPTATTTTSPSSAPLIKSQQQTRSSAPTTPASSGGVREITSGIAGLGVGAGASVTGGTQRKKNVTFASERKKWKSSNIGGISSALTEEQHYDEELIERQPPIIQQQQDELTQQPPPPPPPLQSLHQTTEQTQSSNTVDGREFFRRARGLLTNEEFNSLLSNVKAYNNRQQSRRQTLDNIRGLLGTRHRELYEQFVKLWDS
ncbi:11899_t:CDS:10 [Ambispora gerdemannii]|uniref:11899_t:CDS:1 n=1 Tax=Ambispora gerdemannii TaxID=144530 RepID=A0A9N9GIQ6_9GLOM|nr:11899_t:CDS:10 [Ambispora gerdemannii]